MFLCIDNGKMFVTNAGEADLKLCAKRNSNFHYEPIYYAPCDSVRPHAFEIDPQVIRTFPKKHIKPMFGFREIDSAIDEFFPEEETLSIDAL